MAKGLRFFGTDFNENSFGNDVTVSSASDKYKFMFDGLKDTKWISDGEDSDGNEVSVEVLFGNTLRPNTRVIDSFYIHETNIEDLEIQYYTGSAWATLNSSVATILKSDDNRNIFVQSNTELTVQKIKLVGSDTLTPNEEKEITLFMAFLEAGQFEYFPDFTPKRDVTQSKFKTSDGRNIVIDRGECFEAKIKFESHVNQNDIDLIEELLSRKEPFFIWPCGGDESIFEYSFYPYRFRDIFKVSADGDNAPKVTKNYYKAGYNNTVNLVEVS